MKSKNVETLLQEREELYDLLEDIMERIQEFREEMLTELDWFSGWPAPMVSKPAGAMPEIQ